MDFWTAFFANLPAAILALGSFLGVIFNWLKTEKVAVNVQKIETQTNHMHNVIVDAAEKEGVKKGKAEERANPQPLNPFLGGV